MNQPELKTAYILSCVIAMLSAAVSLGGLLWRDLYRDNAFARATWLGNDWVTLILAINTILVERAALAPKGELPQWAGLTALGLLASLALFLNMGSAGLQAQKLRRKTA